ncbi:MAG: hypothetical protein U0441_13445 [Polyangiaceae bacterium]
MVVSSRSLSSLGTFALTAALSLFGCGDGGSGGSSGTTTTTTTDNRYHPPADGTHVTEKSACEALVNKQEKKLLALKCVGTGQVCPGFLRSEFSTECMEYDEGSVAGCIAYYDQQTTCDGLKAAIDDCVITAYPGTEPAGCSDISTGGTGGTTTTSSGGTGGTTASGGTGGSTSSGGTGGTTASGGTGGVGGM